MKVEMIDELLKECKTSDDIFGEGGLVKSADRTGTTSGINHAPRL